MAYPWLICDATKYHTVHMFSSSFPSGVGLSLWIPAQVAFPFITPIYPFSSQNGHSSTNYELLGTIFKTSAFLSFRKYICRVGKGGHTNTPSLSIPAILPIIIILSNPSNPTNPCRSFKSCQCIYVYRNPANPHNPFQSCQVCKQVLNGWVGGHLCCNRPAVCCWVETAPARLLDATAHSPMAFQHTNKYQRIPTHAHEYRANGVECNWMKKHSFSKKPGGKISFWSEYSTASPNSKWP